MGSLWEVFYSEIKPISCEACGGAEDLYELEGEVLCQLCLSSIQADEDERLTLEERNC
jgi:hypothetical protein